MSFTQDFINKYRGKTVGFPTNKDFNGECLSLVKVYIQERYGIYPPASGCNAARCYWSLFPDPLGTKLRLVRNTAEVIAKEGWIPVWGATDNNEDGHIAIVSDNNASLTHFNSFDQNWNGRQAHIVTHNYNNVEGFLVPKEEEEDMPDALQECLKQHEKLVTEAVAKDEELATKDKQLAAQKGLVTQADKKVYLLNVELDDAKLRIKELEKSNPEEAIKDPLRYVVSIAIGALITYLYTQYPFLGQIGLDEQALAAVLIGLVVKGIDKYQYEAGSRIKLPF